MFLTIVIAFISLIGLMVIHEFGHFILAKRFGVKVEEFGIGYPPRLFGKKIGETIYSLNLLPFGAFVKIYGEEGGIENYRSFSQKPIWQRMLIVLGGVLSFWLVSILLLSLVMGLGAPTAISDEENGSLRDAKVQIAAVAPASPADKSGIKAGDTIREFKIQNSETELPFSINESEGEEENVVLFAFKIQKVREIQEFTEEYKGKEVTLTIERGKEIFDVSLVPRISPPSGEGAMGVALVRTAIKSYPWWQGGWQGIKAAFNLTFAVIEGWSGAIKNIVKGAPSGVQLMGPVGIFSLFNQAGQLGVNYFLQFIAVISIYIALFNILPIPAVDGGKFLFLIIEAFRKKPFSPKIEQNITAVFFALLIMMMIWVTIKDISRIF